MRELALNELNQINGGISAFEICSETGGFIGGVTAASLAVGGGIVVLAGLMVAGLADPQIGEFIMMTAEMGGRAGYAVGWTAGAGVGLTIDGGIYAGSYVYGQIRARCA